MTDLKMTDVAVSRSAKVPFIAISDLQAGQVARSIAARS